MSTLVSVASRSVDRLFVQVAATLPATDAGWTLLPHATVEHYSDGCGQVIGEAAFSDRFGLVKNYNSPNTVLTASDLGYLGQINAGSLTGPGMLVRILCENAAGSVSIDTTTLTVTGVIDQTILATPVWWGVIDGITSRISPGSIASGTAIWKCSGLASLLARSVVRASKDVSSPDPMGFIPKFNTVDGSNYAAGSSTYGAQFITPWSQFQTQWDVREILRVVLSGCGARRLRAGALTGLPWAIADPDGAAAAIKPQYDADGKTVLQVLQELCSPGRGLTWYLTVSGAVPTITVRSVAGTTVTVGTATIPATTLTTTLDITASNWLSDVEIDRDDSQTYDHIEIISDERPWCQLNQVMTRNFGSGTYSGNLGLYEVTVPHKQFDLALNADMTTAGPPNSQGVSAAADPAYGWGGYTGSFTYDNNIVARVPRNSAEMRSGDPGVGGSADPLVAVRLSGVWRAWPSWGVSVGSGPYSQQTIIDDGMRGALTEQIRSQGGAFATAIWMRAAHHLAVSFRRDPTTWPSVHDRTIVYRVPVDQRYQCGGTLVRGFGNLTIASWLSPGTTLTAIADHTDRLREHLARAYLAHFFPRYTITWTDRGIVGRSATVRPGSLLTTYTDGTSLVIANTMIARRTVQRVVVDGVARYDTRYETQPMLPDVQSVL